MNILYRVILLLSLSFLSISSVDVCHASTSEIAVLKSQDLPIYQQAYEGFKRIYTGKIREFNLKGNPDESFEVVKAIKSTHPDVILAIGLLAARVAKENFPQTPVVFCMVFDPVRLSLTGNNITGVSLETNFSDTISRIRDFFPKAKKIGVLFDPKKTGKMVTQAGNIAQKMGLTLIAQEVNSPKDLPDSLRAIQYKIDLLWMIPDSTVVTVESIDFMFLTALENNIPIIAFSEDMVRRGAVMAITPDYQVIGEQAGYKANEVLKGKSPDKIPVSFANKVRTLFNPGIAKKIGVVVNRELMQSLTYQYELFYPDKNVINMPGKKNPTNKFYE